MFIKKLGLIAALFISDIAYGGIYNDFDLSFVSTRNVPHYHKLGLYPAAMFKKTLRETTFKQRHNLCNEAIPQAPHFLKVQANASCSGFLVTDKTLVTAGHCVPNQKTCEQVQWSFYSQVDTTSQPHHFINCHKLLNQPTQAVDIAVIELESPFIDFNTHPLFNEVNPSEVLQMLGHPLGLPLVLTSHGQLTAIENNSFLTNLDAFSINSGSMVINSQHQIVGVLVSGGQDLVTELGNILSPKCNRLKYFDHAEGTERVIRIDQVELILNQILNPKNNQSFL